MLAGFFYNFNCQNPKICSALVQSIPSKSYRLVQFTKLKIYRLVQFGFVIH